MQALQERGQLTMPGHRNRWQRFDFERRSDGADDLSAAVEGRRDDRQTAGHQRRRVGRPGRVEGDLARRNRRTFPTERFRRHQAGHAHLVRRRRGASAETEKRRKF